MWRLIVVCRSSRCREQNLLPCDVVCNNMLCRFTPLDQLASVLKSSATQPSNGHQPKNAKLQKGNYVIVGVKLPFKYCNPCIILFIHNGSFVILVGVQTKSGYSIFVSVSHSYSLTFLHYTEEL